MKILICDSDSNFCESFSNKIRSYGGEDFVKYFNTAFALVTYICDVAKGDIDVLYINTRLGYDSGIDVASDLQGIYPNLKVIFMSEQNNCADAIFEANPTYFILKNGNEMFMEEAYRRVSLSVSEDSCRTLTVKYRGNCVKIPHNKIYYIENSGHKVIFYTEDSRYESILNMSSLLEQLPGQFVQCHRSYVVNVDKIKLMNMGGLELINRSTVPMSRTYYKNVKQALRHEVIRA
ncbi:MAG: LytTR family DNA-binding domain-containing protein [Butyrivibrio sp.]|nr:LytTR family DNA-binding domain-containing protein [Butyrivibrio sp.]